MADFLMQSRDNPMKALGLAFSIITVMVLVTVMISTIIYFRNTKSNRITPARRIIRRRPKEPRHWTFRPRFGRRDQSFGKFFPDDDTSDSPRAKPPTPPRSGAPASASGSLPAERAAAVSAHGVRLNGLQKHQSEDQQKHRRHPEIWAKTKTGGGISSALVSELKMRIEQKINEANQGYYY